MLPAPPLSLALAALNALLSQEPWAAQRLRGHAGQTFRVELAGTALHLAIGQDGRLSAADPDATPDVTLSVVQGGWRQLLASDPQQRMAALRLAGDAALANTLGSLAQDLRPDPEHALAQRLGDLPARRLVDTARWLHRSFWDRATRARDNVVEYLAEETDTLVRPGALTHLTAETKALDGRAEQLARRLDQLAARQGRP